MNKVFPLIICVFALGITLYLLPEFAAFFGFEPLNQSCLSPIVFVSDDNGETFNKTYWSGNLAPSIYDFEADSQDPSFIFAATNQGLFMSRDQGDHWYRYSDLEGKLAKANVYQIEKSGNKPGQFFISLFKNGQGGIYETDDRFFTLKKIFDTKEAAAYKLISLADKLYLGGEWLLEKEFATTKQAGDKIVFKYNADKVFIVAEADDSIELEIRRDGELVTDNAGKEIINSTVNVKDSKLYNLIDEKNGASEHVLEITVKKSGVRIYTFTFG